MTIVFVTIAVSADDMDEKTKQRTDNRISESNSQARQKPQPQVVSDTDIEAESPEETGDSSGFIDAAKILNDIRSSRAKKNGRDQADDDLIVRQSSSYIFLNRKKPRDVTDNILDYWLLSSFEDSLNLTLIEFSCINIPAVKISLDSDSASRLLLFFNQLPLLNNTEQVLKMNPYVNFPIPESVMQYANENSDESLLADGLPDSQEKTSSLHYFVLALAGIGISILGYMVYRIIVWGFMLDQNPDRPIKKETDRDVVAPIDMETFKTYFFQMPSNDKE